jgi:alkaline phosphatase D
MSAPLAAPAAGRRQFLHGAAAWGAALAAPPFIRHARAADGDRFQLGVASGHPRPAGVVLWTRLAGADLPERVAVDWEVAHDEAFTRIAARGSEVADRAWAHSVHAEVASLEPSRWYWYRFGALGGRSAAGRTRTAPAAGAAEPLAFAIASCQRWDHGHYAAWRHMAEEERLDLVVFLGDYIYESATPPAASRVRAHAGAAPRTLDDYRARYAQYKSDPALQRAHAAAPWLAVWDDHEVENDYAGLQSQSLSPAFALRRAAAYQAWWEHMPFPQAMRPRGADMRIHGRHDWGRLARFHALDDRQYRDPQACPRPGRGGSNTVRLGDCPALGDPRRSLLGAAQERWLAEGWSREHRWNLLAQQTLMARVNRHARGEEEAASSAAQPAPLPSHSPSAIYWTDGWDGYAPARARLLGTLAERGPSDVVVLGGDVHANYVADLRPDFDDLASPVVATEFCGTSITSEGLAQSRLDALRADNPHLRYARSDQRGYVHFTLDAERLQARLRVVDDPLDAASGIRTAARFVVAAGKAGAEAD